MNDPNRLRVNTIRGPVHPDELGVTNIHDHLITDATRVRPDPDLTMDSARAAIQELGGFLGTGGKTMVEGTTIDYGRNVFALRYIADRVPDLHLVVTTGFNKGPFFPNWVMEADLDRLAAFLAAEVLEGIAGTDMKAGVIKAGSYLERIEPHEEKVFRAAARAHHLTGAPLYTHTEAGTLALEQLDIFEDEGVDLHRVMIGHLDRKLDFAYHIEVAARGPFLVYDQVGKEKYYPDTERSAMILRLVEAGYADRVLLAGDMGRRSYLQAYGGGPGFGYILETFVPMLHRAGLDRQTLDLFLVGNPRRALAFAHSGVPRESTAHD